MNLETAVKRYFKAKGLPLQPALTFSDIVIKDSFSTIDSRSDIRNLRTKLAGNLFLNIPLVSANMDTVTDAKMAIALARLGGLGFIHQFLPLEERVKEVQKVKRADNALIENPVTILSTAVLGEAKACMAEYKISSPLVIDEANRLLGIITCRDDRFKDDPDLPGEKVMKRMPLVAAGPDVAREEAEAIFEKYKIEKVPLIDEQGFLKGMVSAKDMLKEKEFPNAVRDEKGRLLVGAAIRLNADYLEEMVQLVSGGAAAILLDSARANSRRVRDAVRNIKNKFPAVPLVVGNIDTPEAALMLIKAGADCLKVGIGPGSACKTREATGVGIPQLTAIASCAAVAKNQDIPTPVASLVL